MYLTSVNKTLRNVNSTVNGFELFPKSFLIYKALYSSHKVFFFLINETRGRWLFQNNCIFLTNLYSSYYCQFTDVIILHKIPNLPSYSLPLLLPTTKTLGCKHHEPKRKQQWSCACSCLWKVWGWDGEIKSAVLQAQLDWGSGSSRAFRSGLFSHSLSALSGHVWKSVLSRVCRERPLIG